MEFEIKDVMIIGDKAEVFIDNINKANVGDILESHHKQYFSIIDIKNDFIIIVHRGVSDIILHKGEKLFLKRRFWSEGSQTPNSSAIEYVQGDLSAKSVEECLENGLNDYFQFFELKGKETKITLTKEQIALVVDNGDVHNDYIAETQTLFFPFLLVKDLKSDDDIYTITHLRDVDESKIRITDLKNLIKSIKDSKYTQNSEETEKNA